MRLFQAIFIATVAFVCATAIASAQTVTENMQRLSLKECGAKYRTAKADGSLGTVAWADFRTAQCGHTARKQKSATSTLRSEAALGEKLRRLTFPTALASEFATETPWKARMRTCLKSYHQNKKDDALYGVRWVEQGGGYYSLCAAKLRAGGQAAPAESRKAT